MIEQPKVGIVMVNFNDPSDTIECIKSLEEMSYTNFQIIVVDNNPTPALGKDLPKNVIYLPNNKNLGLAIGNDQGIKKALELDLPYTLLLNNDMTFEKDFLSKLVEATKLYPDFAVITSKICYYDQKDVIWSAGLKSRLLLQPSSMGLNCKDEPKFNEAKEVFSCHCVFLMNNALISKIGLPFDDYFLMFEESEWGIRAGLKGYKNYYYPKAVAYHKVSRSMDSLAEKGRVSVYFAIRNWLLTLRRNYGFFVFMLAFFFHIILGVYYTFMFLFVGKANNISAYWLAILDALLNRTPLRYIVVK